MDVRDARGVSGKVKHRAEIVAHILYVFGGGGGLYTICISHEGAVSALPFFGAPQCVLCLLPVRIWRARDSRRSWSWGVQLLYPPVVFQLQQRFLQFFVGGSVGGLCLGIWAFRKSIVVVVAGLDKSCDSGVIFVVPPAVWFRFFG